MSLVKRFADFTNTSFDVVWNKPVGEVLNILAFGRQYFEYQNKLQEKWKRSH